MNNTSKEEIINQAFKFHSQENITEAAKYYQNFINKGFKDHRVFSNYGVILKNIGKLQEAELSYRKAIEIKPDFADAHSNLGILLKALGKLKDAELSTRKAIELNPYFTDAYLNLGTILRDLGKLQEAEKCLKKAIELSPDFAKAHSNLGNILKDLGKLEELIILSKSTLKLRSINKGYKLRASLLITIANLLQKNYEETLLNLNTSKELISQGAINNIKNAKNRKFTYTFFKFISSLYPLLNTENKNPNLEKIPHIGESHCLSFAHQILYISSKLKQIQPVLITGGKAWHFASDKHNQWKDSLTQQIKNHNYSDEIFLSFGEIDCRKNEGILSYSIKKNKCVSEICEKTIKGYLDYMDQTLSTNHSKRYYFGVPAPTRKKEFLDELDIKRIEMIKIYNSLLKKQVLFRGSYFLDVYKLTSTNDGENNNLHMCDETHLSPKSLSILFKNYLYKN